MSDQSLDSRTCLAVNAEIYDRSAAALLAQLNEISAEAAADKIQELARFAARFHPGRFFDSRLENVLLDIGQNGLEKLAVEFPVSPSPLQRSGRRRVLHVALDVRSVGGHARLMRHWMREDKSSCHSLILTGQSLRVQVPTWLIAPVEESGGSIVCLRPERPLLERAMHLRLFAQEHADLVAMHVIWPDSIPAIAFANAGSPPILFIDQCDHYFQLGTGVSDALVQLRELGNTSMASRRGISRAMILPIPLAEPTEAISRGEARARLGISLRDTLLLSVGRAVKYRPCGKDDFLSVINELLDQSPGTRAVIVGADESEMRAFLRKPLHPRCRLAGNVDDPQAFRIAADIYLESFPFGSQTALLEAGLAGLPVVLAPGPECAMLVANGRSITDCVDRPADQAEYVRHALRLIRDEGRRASLGATLRRSILSVHVGAAWRDSLADMYKCLDGIAHRPTRSGPEEWRSDADSAGLARWGVLTAAGEKYQPLLSNRGAVTRDLNVALAAKQVGRPEAAFVASARVLAQHWNVAASWRLFAGTCASAVASALRGLY